MNAKPLETSAAWRGAELFERADWLHTLAAEEVSELTRAVKAVTTQRLDLDAVTSETFPLPRFGERLAAIQHSLEHGSGATMIRGLPIEAYDETELRTLFWGLARHVGTPLSQSANGERIFSVRDEGYAKEDPRARGPNTRKRLSFHTDRCDVISFLCVRQARSGGENRIVSSVSIYNELLETRPDLLRVLMQPYYYKRHNVDLGNERPYCAQPIFSFCENHFAANLLRVLIERAYAMPELPDMSAVQREALDAIEKLAENPEFHVSFTQQPGDILFLNNWVTLHRREEFVDHDTPELRRHLLRIWLAVPNSRPLDAAFAANYGATAAGAIRGGMQPSR